MTNPETKSFFSNETDKFPVTRMKVKVDSVFPNSYNPNFQTADVFKKEIESIKAFGFIDSILVRETETEGVYEIIDGEHRWKAAKELGFVEVTIDNLGKITDSAAKTLTLIMNNTRGQDDILKRAKMLKEIESGQLSLLPFDTKQIEEEIKLLDFDFSQFEKVSITDDLQEDYKEALNRALMLEKVLRRIHSSSKDTNTKLLLEVYFDWVRKFKDQ